jgi:hypothetical protein
MYVLFERYSIRLRLLARAKSAAQVVGLTNFNSMARDKNLNDRSLSASASPLQTMSLRQHSQAKNGPVFPGA